MRRADFQQYIFTLPWEEFKNVGDDTIPAYGVVEIVDCEEMGEEFVLHGQLTETTTAQRSHFINGPVSVPAGGFGSCVLPSGKMIAMYGSTATPEYGQVCGPLEGEAGLILGVPGFRVISSAPEGNVIVVSEPAMRVKAQLSEDLDEDGTAEADLFDANTPDEIGQGSIECELGLPVTDTIPSGTVVWCDRVGEKWLVTGAACE